MRRLTGLRIKWGTFSRGSAHIFQLGPNRGGAENKPNSKPESNAWTGFVVVAANASAGLPKGDDGQALVRPRVSVCTVLVADVVQ